MQHSPWKAARFSASQISYILCSPKFQYPVHKILPLVLIMSQINQVHSVSSVSRSSNWCLYFMFPHQNSSCILLLLHTCHVPHLPHASPISSFSIIFGEQYKSWSFLCSSLLPPVTSFFFGPNVFLRTLFVNTLSLCFALLLLLPQGPSHTPRMHRSLQAYCATLFSLPWF